MKNWNALDKFIGTIRYAHVSNYIRSGASVVDIGCGRDAKFLMCNKDIIKGGIGMDFRVKEEKPAPNIKLINNQNMKTFPIEDNKIDTVFLNAVLEHLEEPVDMLLECKRILKNEGEIVMTTPTRMAKPILEFMAFRLHIINEEEILEHKHYWTKKDIHMLSKKLDMSLIKYGYFEMGLNSLIVLKKKIGK